MFLYQPAHQTVLSLKFWKAAYVKWNQEDDDLYKSYTILVFANIPLGRNGIFRKIGKFDRQSILTKHDQASTSQVQHRCQAKVEMDATDGAEPFPKQNIYIDTLLATAC